MLSNMTFFYDFCLEQKMQILEYLNLPGTIIKTHRNLANLDLLCWTWFNL